MAHYINTEEPVILLQMTLLIVSICIKAENVKFWNVIILEFDMLMYSTKLVLLGQSYFSLGFLLMLLIKH